jgi:hypothetical protein
MSDGFDSTGSALLGFGSSVTFRTGVCARSRSFLPMTFGTVFIGFSTGFNGAVTFGGGDFSRSGGRILLGVGVDVTCDFAFLSVAGEGVAELFEATEVALDFGFFASSRRAASICGGKVGDSMGGRSQLEGLMTGRKVGERSGGKL